MSNEQMTDKRVQELIDCYGGDSSRWPEQERSAAVARVKRSSVLQACCREAAELDALLGSDAQQDTVAHVDHLSRKILEGLPSQQPAVVPGQMPSLSLWQWLANVLPARRLAAFASVLVLVFVSLIVVDYSGFSEDADITVTSTEFDRWGWEQTTGEVVNGNDPVDTMVSMLAPELVSENGL